MYLKYALKAALKLDYIILETRPRFEYVFPYYHENLLQLPHRSITAVNPSLPYECDIQVQSKVTYKLRHL